MIASWPPAKIGQQADAAGKKEYGGGIVGCRRVIQGLRMRKYEVRRYEVRSTVLQKHASIFRFLSMIEITSFNRYHIFCT